MMLPPSQDKLTILSRRSQVQILKSNLQPKRLQTYPFSSSCGKNGVGVDVVSGEEAQIAMMAGFLPSEIMFTPSGVDFEELIQAVSWGLNINLDNLPVLEKFGKKYGDSYPCGIRLNPNIMAGGNIKISTGHSNSKFGIFSSTAA